METSPLRTWTPAVYETLQADLTQLAELLDICFPVFHSVLQNPPSSEADRQKLLARISPASLLPYIMILC